MRLIESDLFASLGRERYDLIICNPPYVNQHSMAALPREYQMEPTLALAGGADGMDAIRSILSGAAARLTRQRDACLVLEIGHEKEHFDAAFGNLDYTGLTTSGGDEQVVHISALALGRAAA